MYILNKYVKPKLTWVNTENMTEEEKLNNKSHETTGGFLRFNKTIHNGLEVRKTLSF